MELFSFEKNWEDIKPVLDDPLAVSALDLAMGYECTRSSYLPDWDSARGPWYFSASEVVFRDQLNPLTPVRPINELGAWANQSGCPSDHDQRMRWRAHNFAEYAKQRQELATSILPRPGTVDWYRCYGACMGLAVWCGVIGRMLMPKLEWLVIYTSRHVCAVGSARPWPEASYHLHEAVFADLLWGDLFSSDYILDNLLDGDRCRSCRLDDYANVLQQETLRIGASTISRPPTHETQSLVRTGFACAV